MPLLYHEFIIELDSVGGVGVAPELPLPPQAHTGLPPWACVLPPAPEGPLQPQPVPPLPPEAPEPAYELGTEPPALPEPPVPPGAGPPLLRLPVSIAPLLTKVVPAIRLWPFVVSVTPLFIVILPVVRMSPDKPSFLVNTTLQLWS